MATKTIPMLAALERIATEANSLSIRSTNTEVSDLARIVCTLVEMWPEPASDVIDGYATDSDLDEVEDDVLALTNDLEELTARVSALEDDAAKPTP